MAVTLAKRAWLPHTAFEESNDLSSQVWWIFLSGLKEEQFQIKLGQTGGI